MTCETNQQTSNVARRFSASFSRDERRSKFIFPVYKDGCEYIQHFINDVLAAFIKKKALSPEQRLTITLR